MFGYEETCRFTLLKKDSMLTGGDGDGRGCGDEFEGIVRDVVGVDIHRRGQSGENYKKKKLG